MDARKGELVTWSIRHYDAPFGTETQGERQTFDDAAAARAGFEFLTVGAQHDNTRIVVELWDDEREQYAAHFSLLPPEVAD